MRISALTTYDVTGTAHPRQQLDLGLAGIEGNRACNTWRQVLLLPQQVLDRFRLEPGQLRENILLSGSDDIHQLPSGSVLEVAGARLRLTFHCEPCQRISHLLPPKKLLHQRGYLAQVVQAGRVRLGDPITVSEQRYEAIPYAAAERIRWYLQSLERPIMAADLVATLGLPKSYCRALPALLRRLPEADAARVRFASRRR